MHGWKNEAMDECRNEWMDRWMDGWMDGWMDEWTFSLMAGRTFRLGRGRR